MKYALPLLTLLVFSVSFLLPSVYAESSTIRTIIASSDDCTGDNTTFNLNGVYTQVGTTTKFYMGLRFTNVTLGAYDEIVSANIKFKAYATLAGAVMTKVYGELNANPTTFINASDYLARTRTTTASAWLLTSWTINNYYYSPSIISVIDEIRQLPSWVSGNSMVFLLEYPSATYTAYRRASSYDGGSATAQLEIKYRKYVTFTPYSNQQPFVIKSSFDGNYYYYDIPAFNGSIIQTYEDYDLTVTSVYFNASYELQNIIVSGPYGLNSTDNPFTFTVTANDGEIWIYSQVRDTSEFPVGLGAGALLMGFVAVIAFSIKKRR